jgi:hypothetical protein
MMTGGLADFNISRVSDSLAGGYRTRRAKLARLYRRVTSCCNESGRAGPTRELRPADAGPTARMMARPRHLHRHPTRSRTPSYSSHHPSANVSTYTIFENSTSFIFRFTQNPNTAPATTSGSM